MKLLRFIFLNSEQKLGDRFGERFEQWLVDDPVWKRRIRLKKVEHSDFMEWLCEGIFPEFQLSVHADDIYKRTARVIGETVIELMEPELIRHFIQKDYGYTDTAEIDRVYTYCQTNTAAPVYRLDKLTSDIYPYLCEHTDINIAGLLRFRLQSYTDELREVIEYSIDEYVLDQQYMEFISLLKYFVHVQEPKIPTVHLMHKQGDIYLLDEQMQPLQKQNEHQNQDEQAEDLVVSTLISTAPEKIIIHTRNPDFQVIRTLQQIFEDRTELCLNCTLCNHSPKSKKSIRSWFYT